ncbi:MAG: hypothetical protein K6U89_19685 [Chloroflexi bacterium]|nr:hypothetical protein [Chloroflexota bacterium]
MRRRLALALLGALAAASAPAAEPLGRFFFTPAQRESLDAARAQNIRAAVATQKSEEEPAPAPEVVTYGGVVRRSDGRTVVWINDQALPEEAARAGTTVVRRVRPDGSVTLEVPQSGQRVELKVGQSVELLSGTIAERYARRAFPPPELKPKPAPGEGSRSAPEPQTPEPPAASGGEPRSQ